MKRIICAIATLCVNGTAFGAPAAADLSIIVTSPANIQVESSFSAQVIVRNIGTKKVGSASAQITLPSGLILSAIPSGCSSISKGLQCSLGAVAAGAQIVKSLSLIAPQRAGSYRLSAVTSGNVVERSQTNNSAFSDIVVGANIEIVADQNVSITICSGSTGPLSWSRDCAHIPSSHLFLDATLLANGLISVSEPGYSNSSYVQNQTFSDITLQFVEDTSGLTEATFSGAAISQECFEGTIAYPQTPGWYGAFEMCLVQ